MKKKLAIALSLAMVMTMALTACGGDNGGSSSNKGGSSSAQPPAGGSSTSQPGGDSGLAPKDGGTNLTFTTGGEAGTYYGFGSVIAGKVGRFHTSPIHHPFYPTRIGTPDSPSPDNMGQA